MTRCSNSPDRHCEPPATTKSTVSPPRHEAVQSSPSVPRIGVDSVLRLLLIPALLILFAGGAVSAQEDEAEVIEDGPYVESIDVNVVNVEVYVTDKKGERVPGLTRDDFELEVDGKPVAITNFYAVEDGRVRVGGLPTEPEPEEALPDRSEEKDTLPEGVPLDQRLHLIVYVDNFNLHPFSRNRTLRTLRTFLRSRLNPGDRVMLVSYDRTFHVRQPFTTDHDSVANATYELEELSAHASSFTSERADILEEIYEADRSDGPLVLGRISGYASSRMNDVEFTLDALGNLVDQLAGLPGRKALLYVSDGLPLRVAADVYHALYEKFDDSSLLMEANRYDLSRRYTALAARANANRVTFYTLDAEGLRTYSFMDVSNRTVGGGSSVDRVYFTNIRSSLQTLARETGGQVLMNTNDFGPLLDRVAEDFESYYSLGFMPVNEESGRYHDIDVDLKKGRGLEVRSRAGYRDKPVATRMSEGTLAALHFGFESNPLDIRVEPGVPQLHDRDRYIVPFALRVPLGNLTFVPQDEVYRGRLRIFIAALDSEGGMAPVQEVSIPIDVPADEMEKARGQLYEYTVPLEMRGGRQVVAFGVRDEVGATEGFVTRGLTVGS